ncbi:FHA domain-containing protein [Calothrix sp. NIES-4071]|nr:FHA domain-containing protein [Calothrix sp. NIES-4071]BAZ64278.1 FHA domain-containing protein [Calothrix sp. NIES-4105]
MSDTHQLPLSVQPVISYPREAQVGKTYLMTIDLETNAGEWVYEKEEYSIYCMLDVSVQEAPLFSIKTVGEPAIILHRFGGTYGAAKFLLTAASEEMEGEIKITLINEWGAPIRVIILYAVRVVQEVDRVSQIIGEYEQEVVSTKSLEQEFQETLLTVASEEKEFTEPEEVLAPNISVELRNLPGDPSLNLAITRLLVCAGTNNFAIWVVRAPYSSGHVMHDCVWTPNLTQVWQEWQQFFAGHSNLDVSPANDDIISTNDPLPIELPQPATGQPTNYAGRLMQYFGNCLWLWVFDGAILNSLEHSRAIAFGHEKSLRLRLEIRDPYLVSIPWEIMQRPGQAAISLSQNVIFSRTTSDVERLPVLPSDAGLNILLVLGADENLQLEAEAELLKRTLTQGSTSGSSRAYAYAPCIITKLIQPTPFELIAALETRAYNMFFYAGHGLRGPDGGILRLHPEATLNGIELAEVLTRNGIKLAVFNSCWGAQPFAVNHQPIPYSSLAEVLIRHGVPAVLGMRDEIADRESLSFIQAFSEALRSRRAIDEAVADARQKLLSLYKFNQPGWTLPVLYLHPEFDGQLLRSLDESITELPTSFREFRKLFPTASLRILTDETKQLLPVPIARIGRATDNNIIIPNLSVSRQHAQIICRDCFTDAKIEQVYYLRDDSTEGTFIYQSGAWQRIHHEEVLLQSGMQLKFGSSRSDTWEFIIED